MSRVRPSRKRGRHRWVALVLVVLVIASALWFTRDSDASRRARADAIVALVDSIARGMTELGLDVAEGEDDSWRGLRRYEPAGGAWVLFDDSAAPERAVVLVHGLDEPGGIWDGLAPALAAEGHEVIRFDYANDQAIAHSADALTAALSRMRDDGVGEIDLVCHSMGGLVARDALSRDGYALRGPRVATMITLGTPHRGSPWARMRSVAEAREQVQRWAQSDDLDPVRLLGFLRDGDGRAGVDLMPGSAFLTELDQRSLPAGTRVVCVVGRVDEPTTIVGTMGQESARGLLRDILGEGQSALALEQIDRLGSELGDGVVPESSAIMDGADEVVSVRANHRGMIRTIELEEFVRSGTGLPTAEHPPAIRVVLDRLRRD